MTELYFVRHGQTEWNKEMRFQGGRGNSELLPQSFDDMAKLAEHLADTTFDKVYSSTLKRAAQTAEHTMNLWAAARGEATPTIHQSDALIEVGLGEWEGMLKADIQARYPKDYHTYQHDLANFSGAGFGGEGHDRSVERFRGFLQKAIAEAGEHERLIFFSHGMMLLFGISDLLGIPKANIRDRGGLSNTSTTILRTLDGGQTFELVDWNRDDYLQVDANDASRKII